MHAVQLRQLVDCYCTTLTRPISSEDRSMLSSLEMMSADRMSVTVADVGLSDHHLLQWSVPAARSPPPVEVLQTRPWRNLNVDDLRAALSTSSLCHPDEWPADVDDMAAMYDRQLTAVLDQLIPLREVTRRPRPLDPWFDAECRAAKRQTRRLARAHAAACRRLACAASCGSSTPQSVAIEQVAAAKSAWYDQRRPYRQLRHQKCTTFWLEQIETDRFRPVKLWESVDKLLGRGRTRAC